MSGSRSLTVFREINKEATSELRSIYLGTYDSNTLQHSKYIAGYSLWYLVIVDIYSVFFIFLRVNQISVIATVPYKWGLVSILV